MSVRDGRQWAATLADIRADHRQRYRFAVQWLAQNLPGARVLDAACGCGYGSAMLAAAGFRVLGVDKAPAAIAFARRHYGDEARFALHNLRTPVNDRFDAVVSFETLEHVADAVEVAARFRAAAPWLLASVPNQDVVPCQGHPHHIRHYTPAQFEQLLSGYRLRESFCQYDKQPGLVRPGFDGGTLIVVAETEAKR